MWAIECPSSSLLNQADVDAFGTSGCTSLSNLTIGPSDSITNLGALSTVTTVDTLLIHQNSLLPNLDGLENLTTVSALRIRENAALQNVQGLSGVISGVTELEVANNDSLSNLDGLIGISGTVLCLAECSAGLALGSPCDSVLAVRCGSDTGFLGTLDQLSHVSQQCFGVVHHT